MDSSAQNQLLGYLYQIRYALYLLIRSEKDETSICIERLDDISLEELGQATELIQTKHHSKLSNNLTNTSVDLWKTIRIWSEFSKTNNIDNLLLTLVTTNSVPESDTSITKKLRPNSNRNNKSISEELTSIAELARETNKTLIKSFDAYLSLSLLERGKLVSAISIIDNSPNIQNIEEKTKQLLQVRFENRNAIYSRLEGWWFETVISHLKNQSKKAITRLEVYTQIADINERFKPDNLPVDYAFAEPPEKSDPDTDQRQFVTQLKIIGLENPYIEFAIKDYYRAFEQRSRWQREGLLKTNELQNYENKLVEEWQRERIMRHRDVSDEESYRAVGSELFRWAENAQLHIRPQVTESFIMRGSFHILADKEQPSIWWHPKFLERLQQQINPTDMLSKSLTPTEVKNLYNPAFCAMLLHEGIKSYHSIKLEGMPYALLFLIFPIILHSETRNLLPRSLSAKFHTWLATNQVVRVGFAERTADMVKITKEAILFGIEQGYFAIDDKNNFIITEKKFKRKKEKEKVNASKTEVDEIVKRAKFMGGWYAHAGTLPSIYILLGVRP